MITHMDYAIKHTLIHAYIDTDIFFVKLFILKKCWI